ncbi:MAG: hypothetical protein IT383_14960 [Deltaproteobacteria bacterium]|nr:hypothetical protein [Deltaproteobacteria bacterium]
MRLRLLLTVVGTVAALAACPGPPAPTPADAAAYLGLGEGVTHVYQVGQGITETHELSTSSIISEDGGLVFDLVATQNGFVTDATQDRTFAIEVGVDYARVRRVYDCIVRCGELSAPIALFAIPLDEGEQNQGAVDVSVSENGGAPVVASETHTVLVGGETEVTVPAGSYTGTTVSWTRASEGATDTAILVVVPEVGIVRWDGFDGSRLELAP